MKPRFRPALFALIVAIAGGAGFAIGAPAPRAPTPVKNPSLASPSGFASKDGAFLYQAICQGCHMADGRGASGAGTYPALADNPRLQSAYYPMFLVLNGQKAMPGFGRMLDDEQVAAVVNHVRTHFGNRYADAVTAKQVEALRK